MREPLFLRRQLCSVCTTRHLIAAQSPRQISGTRARSYGLKKTTDPAPRRTASTTVLTNVRFVDRSMDTFRSEPARLRRVPIAAWRCNLLRDVAYAGAPRGRKPLGKAGISRGSRWAGVFFAPSGAQQRESRK